MKTINKFFIALCIIIFLGCEKELEYELEYEGQKLVVYGFINPIDTVTIQVSKTLPALQDRKDDLSVTNAEVLLFEDDQLVEQLTHVELGNYISLSGFKPVMDKAYHIEVNAPDFPSVKSKSETIPIPQLINELEFVDSIRSSSIASGETVTVLLNLAFDDPTNDNNFYAINVLGESTFGYLDIPNSFTVDDVYDQGGGAQCDFFYNSELEFGIGFSDYCFEGAGQKIPLVVGVFSSQSGLTLTRLKTNFYTLSETLFRFSKSLAKYRDNEIEPLEPATIVSNIEGGYGVFGAYIQDDIWLDL